MSLEEQKPNQGVGFIVGVTPAEHTARVNLKANNEAVLAAPPTFDNNWVGAPSIAVNPVFSG